MSLIEKFYNNMLEIGTFTTTDDENNNVIVEVEKDKLTIKTCQKNGWIRINVYHNDLEKTKEEYYEN